MPYNIVLYIIITFFSWLTYYLLEQRVSSLLVSIMVGGSVVMAPLLRLVPMAVLFGVFLYMGISSIDGIQFFERLKLVFMPVKHHSEAPYVRHVSICN